MALTDLQREDLAEMNPEALTADGFDDALIGVTCHQPGRPPLAVYDRAKCIAVLTARDGMAVDEAEEFFEFNVIGSWLGENTPMFVALK